VACDILVKRYQRSIEELAERHIASENSAGDLLITRIWRRLTGEGFPPKPLLAGSLISTYLQGPISKSGWRACVSFHDPWVWRGLGLGFRV